MANPLPEIKAMPTLYKGITFRSKLEAQHAVLLDELGITDWIYEPQAYDLKSGRYLPDFWLPTQGFFLEVKPEHSESDPRWYELSDATEKDVVVSRGILNWASFHFGENCEECGFGERWNGVRYQDGGYGIERNGDHPYYWCVCTICESMDVQYEGRSERNYCKCFRTPAGRLKNEKIYTGHDDLICRAYKRARDYGRWKPVQAGPDLASAATRSCEYCEKTLTEKQSRQGNRFCSQQCSRFDYRYRDAIRWVAELNQRGIRFLVTSSGVPVSLRPDLLTWHDKSYLKEHHRWVAAAVAGKKIAA